MTDANDTLPCPSEEGGPLANADEATLLADLRVVIDRRPTASESAAPLAPMHEGARLGRYAIGRLLGEGGMARVYRAIDTETGQAVAVKFLKAQYQGDGPIAQRFEREARTMATIQHANVVRILGVERCGEAQALVMELVPNGSLRRRLDTEFQSKTSIPLGETVSLIRQAAAGIDAAHRMGIIHRDIKPSNLLLDAQGTVKVADFGAIRVMEGATWLTGMGQQIGTPGYMSPEQCQGSRVTPASDVYSLGATLFELITGRVPFHVEEASPFAMMLKHISEPAPDPRAFRSETPAWLAAVVAKSLEKTPHNRFATAGDFATALANGDTISEDAARESIARLPGHQINIHAVRTQLQHLSHRAITCWACRCARRVQSLNGDPRVEAALAMAEATVTEASDRASDTSLTRALDRIRSLRAASLRAAYTGEHSPVSPAAVEAARAAAAAAACAAARCIDDASADAAFAARSAVAALTLADQGVKTFWKTAKQDYQMLLKATAGQEGTVGRPLSESLLKSFE
ncbi:MAG: serine/threonine protein kinase [Phycisphaerae bacterium]|nr:serine/threonine protein kinase [Phycisphaerae bacterium]